MAHDTKEKKKKKEPTLTRLNTDGILSDSQAIDIRIHPRWLISGGHSISDTFRVARKKCFTYETPFATRVTMFLSDMVVLFLFHPLVEMQSFHELKSSSCDSLLGKRYGM